MIRKINKKSRKAEVFGMSFSMIFSIILIAFFVVVAFIGIRYFLSYQRNVQVNLMVQDLQKDIDDAWNSGSVSFSFNATLPSGFQVDYLCFMDFNKDTISANNVESGIYDNVKHSSYDTTKNLYFYVGEAPYTVKSFTIKHITLEKKNPVCFRIIKNKVSIKVQKKESNPLVEVYY